MKVFTDKSVSLKELMKGTVGNLIYLSEELGIACS